VQAAVAEKTDTAARLPFDIQNLQISSEIGSIQEYYRGKSSHAVILIQDAHAIPDAQLHIRELIGHLQKTYGTDRIALEGASGQLDMEIFRYFPDQKTLLEVLEEFQGEGHLPGAVAAAILDDPGIRYWGIEDWGLYEEGIHRYLEAMGKQEAINQKLKVKSKKMLEEKEKKYSKKLLEIDRLLESFEANKASLPEVLKKLSEVRAPAKGSELALLLQESEKRTEDGGSRSEKGDAEIYAEVRKVAEALKKTLSPQPSAKSDLQAFSREYQQFQTSQITPEAFALFLKQLAVKNKLPIKISKTLDFAARRQKRMQDIRGTKLFVDFEKYAEEVKGTLFANDGQRRLNARARQLRLLEKLNQLELTYEEWNKIKELETGNLKFEETSLRASDFEPLTLFKTHFAFYENAQMRDRALFDRLIPLLGKEALLASNPDLQAPVVAVAGGFHAEGLTKQLRESGVSYVLISPRIDALPEKTAYRDQMRGEVPWRKYFRVSGGKIGLYDAFVRGTRDRLLFGSRDPRHVTRNTQSGQPNMNSQADSGEQDAIGLDEQPITDREPRVTLKFWRDEILRNLAAENRLSESGKYTRFLDEIAGRNPGIPDPGVEQIKADARRFVEGLRRLNAEGQINERNILKILGANTAISWSAGTAVAQPGSRISMPKSLVEIPGAPIGGMVPFADPAIEFAPGRAELREDENPPGAGTPSDRIGRMMSGAREILREQNPDDRYLTGTFFDTLNWCFSWGHLNSVTSERFANQIDTIYRMFDHAMSSPERFVEVRALYQGGIPYAEFYVVADVSQGSSTDLENLIAAEISKKNAYKLAHHLRTIPSPYSAGQKLMVAVFEVNLDNKNSWATPTKTERPGKIAEMRTRVNEIREALVEAIGAKLRSIPNEEVYAGTWTSSAADIKMGTAVVLEEPAADMNVVADNLYASLRVSDPLRMTAEKNRLLREDLEAFDRRIEKILGDLTTLPKVFESITVNESDLERIAAYIRDLADQTRQIATKPRPQLTRYRQTAASIFTHLVLTQINEKRLYGQNAGELTPEQMIYAEKIVFEKRIFLDATLYASEGLQAQAVAREKEKFQEALKTQTGQTTFSGAEGFQAIVDLMASEVESEIEKGVPAKYAILNTVPPILDQLKIQERIAVELDSMVRGILDALVRSEFVSEGSDVDIPDGVSSPAYPGEIILFANNLYQARLEKILEIYPNITAIVVKGRRAVGHWLFAARARGIRVFRMEDNNAFDPADPRLNGKTVILVSHKEIGGTLENRVLVQPSAETKEKYKPYLDSGQDYGKVAEALSGEPAVSQDGIPVDFAANADSPETISEAIALGANGARLVRTEYLFDQNVEALRVYLEAYERYREARSTGENLNKMKDALEEATEGLVAYFADRFYEMGVSAQEGIVNIRAYDHQPDKQEKSQLRGKMKDKSGNMIYGPACYMTPLGQRLLRIQIEAVFRANFRDGSSRLQLMFPTSRSPRELLEFLGRKDWKGFDREGDEQRRLDDLARKDLRLMRNVYRVVRRRVLRALEAEVKAGKGHLFSPELQQDAASATKLGYMIESLEWIRILEEVLRESEFISLGTNDLTQSIFREKGITRDNPDDAPYFEELRPEVLEKLLEIFDRVERFNTLRAAQSPEAGMISVSICGDLASFEQFQPFIPYSLLKLAARKQVAQEEPAQAAIAKLNLPIHLSVTAMDIPKLKQVVRGLKTGMTVFFDRMSEKGFVVDDAARALVRQIENAHKTSDFYAEILAGIKASSAVAIPESVTPPVEYSLEHDLKLARAEEVLKAAQEEVQKVWDEMPKVATATSAEIEAPVTLEQTFRMSSQGLHSMPEHILITEWLKILERAGNPDALEASLVYPDGTLRKINSAAKGNLFSTLISGCSPLAVRVTAPESLARAYFSALGNPQEEWTTEKMFSPTFAEAEFKLKENPNEDEVFSFANLTGIFEQYPDAEFYAEGNDPGFPVDLRSVSQYQSNEERWAPGKTVKIYIGEKGQAAGAERPARVGEALAALRKLRIFKNAEVIRDVAEPKIKSIDVSPPVTLEQTFRMSSQGLHSMPEHILITEWLKILERAGNPDALEASLVYPDGTLRKINSAAKGNLFSTLISGCSPLAVRVTAPESLARAYFSALGNPQEEWTTEKMFSPTFAEAEFKLKENPNEDEVFSFANLTGIFEQYPDAEFYAEGNDPGFPVDLRSVSQYQSNEERWAPGKTVKIYIGEKGQAAGAERPARVGEALETLKKLSMFEDGKIVQSVPEPKVETRSEMRSGEPTPQEREKTVIKDMLRQIFVYAGVSDIADLITRAQARTAGEIVRYQLTALGLPAGKLSEQDIFNDLRLFVPLVFGAGPLGFIRYMAWRGASYLEKQGRFRPLQALLFRLAYSQKIVQADVANLMRSENAASPDIHAVTEALIPVPAPHFRSEMRHSEIGTADVVGRAQSLVDDFRLWLKAASVRLQRREDLKYFDRLAGEAQIPKAIASNLRDVISRFSHPLGRYEIKLLTWLASGPELPAELRADQVLWAVRDLAGTPGLEDVLRNVPFGGSSSKSVTGQIGFLSEIMFAYRLKQTGYDILAMGQTFEPNVEVDIFVMDRKTRETFLVEAKNVRAAGLKKSGDRVAQWLANVVGPKIQKYEDALRELNRSAQVWEDARESLNIPEDHPARAPEKFFVAVSASVARLTTGRFTDGIKEADLERLFQRENYPPVKVLSVSLPESEQVRKIAERFPGFELSPTRREVLTPLPDEKKPVVGTKTGKEQVYRQHALTVNRFTRDMLRVYTGLDVKLNVASRLPDHLEDAAQDEAYGQSRANLEKILEQNDHSGLMTRTWLAGLMRELPGSDHLWHRFLVGTWLRDGNLSAVESPESPGTPATDQETLGAWRTQFVDWAKSQKPQDNQEFLDWKDRQDRMSRQEMRTDFDQTAETLETRLMAEPLEVVNERAVAQLGAEGDAVEEGLQVEPEASPKEKLLHALKTRYGGIVLSTRAGELWHLTFREGEIFQRRMAFEGNHLAYADSRTVEWSDSLLSEDFRLFEIPQRQMPWPLDPDLEARIRKFIADSNQKAKDRKILMEQGGVPKKELLRPDVDSDVENEFFDRLKTILPKLDNRYRIEGILGWGTEVAVYELTDQIDGQKLRLALKVAGGIGAIPEVPDIAESMLEAQMGNIKAIESLIRENPTRLSHIAVPAVFKEIRMDDGVKDGGLLGIIVEFIDFGNAKILVELGDPVIPVNEREQTYQDVKVLIDLLLEQKRLKLLDLQSDVILKKPDGKYLLSDAGIMPALEEAEDLEEVRNMLCNLLRAKLNLEPIPAPAEDGGRASRDGSGPPRAEMREDKSLDLQVKDAGAKAGVLLVEYLEGRDDAKAGELARITLEVSPAGFEIFVAALAQSAETAADETAVASHRERKTIADEMSSELYATATQIVLAEFSALVAEILKKSPEKSGAVFAFEIPISRDDIESRSFAAILKAALSAFGTEKVKALVPVTPANSKLTASVLKALAEAGITGKKLETQVRKIGDLDGIGVRRDSGVCLVKDNDEQLRGKFSGVAVGVDRAGYSDNGYNFQDQVLRMVAQMTIALAAVTVLTPKQIEALNRVRQSPGGREKLNATEAKEIKEALSGVLLKQETLLGLQSIDDLINGIENGNLSFVMKTLQTMIASVRAEAQAKISA
jgi:phosphoenolpyruvate-protein kinase (PTS system EI component)